MPRKSRALPQEIVRWKLYVAATNRNIADFGDLKANLNQFAGDIDELERDNQKQEKMKADLKALTGSITKQEDTARATAANIKRRWEAKYGPRSPKMRELVPATEGRVRERPPEKIAD